MIVSFSSDNIQKKLSFLGHAVSSRGQLPILANFLIEAKNGKLVISATDLEIGISSSIPASVEEEGSVTIPAKNFSDLISNIGNQKIKLVLKDGALNLVSEKIKASFQTMAVEDFPKLYEEKGEAVATMSKKDIEESFAKVVFAAAIDSSRPALSGILLHQDKKSAQIVATDGYRLSLQKNALTTTKELEKPLVIPARIVRELMLIKEGEDDVRVFVSEKSNQILFSMGETSLVGRLIEQDYPEYEKIIPADFGTKVEVDKEGLLNAIKICSVFARETANIVKFSIGKDKIIIYANSPSVGEDSVEVQALVKGEENEIAFNAKYLLDFLSSVGKDELVFEMTGPLNPGVFKIKGDDSFLHLIMPIRVE